MNKIAVIGGRDSVLGFRALGLETCIAENGEQAKAAIHRMAKENYAIIYLTEYLAAQIPAEIERRREDLSPAIILIPGREGSLGIGMAGVRTATEQAVGADILYKGAKTLWERSLKSPARWSSPRDFRKRIWRTWSAWASSTSSARS